MSRHLRHLVALLSVALLAPLGPVVAGADAPPTSKVNGTLTEIDGIPVLRVWGTPHERGYAQGFLLAETTARLVDAFLAGGRLGESAEEYEQQVLPRLSRMKIDPEIEAELRGLLAGFEARLGGPLEVPFLGRALRYDDLVAVNSTSDLRRSGCSSFAGWGRMTKDGHTVAGRNMDWPEVPAMIETQMILVNVPSPDSGKLGWVAVTWPAYLGCVTAMNAEGVTVATHDAPGHAPSGARGFTPYSLTFRKAVESARAQTAVEDIARVIREGVSIVGNNMMVTRPHTGGGPAAVVFEFDGDLSDGGGLTIREPEGEQPFLVCTNHFRKRSDPTPYEGRRFGGLSRTLDTIAAGGGKRHLTLKRAWKMLGGVSMSEVITHHSVVFEPNKRLMQVAFAEPGRHAPRCKKVTLDVQKLIAGDYPGGK